MSPHIQNLTAANLKNRATLSIDLAPLSIIYGPAGSGKTAIPDGIALAAIGYVPRYGKKAINIAAGPGLELSAAIKLSDGTTAARAWKKSKSGGMSKKGTAPDESPVPLISLDPETFTGANATKRAQIIAGHYGAEGNPTAEILKKVQDCLTKARLALPVVKAPEDFSEWVDVYEERLADAAKEAKGSAERMKKTLEGLTALDDEPPAPIPAAEIQAAQEAVGAARANLDRLNKEAATLEREIATLSAYAPKVEFSEGYPRELEWLKQERANLEKDIAAQQAKLSASNAAAARNKGIKRQYDTLELELRGLEYWLEQNPERSLSAFEGETDQTKLKLARAQAQQALNQAAAALTEARVRLENANNSDLSGSVCPCCGAEKANWDESKVWDQSEAITRAQEEHETATQRHREAQGLYDNAEKALEMAIDYAADKQAYDEWHTKNNRAQEVEKTMQEQRSMMEEECPPFTEDDAESLAADLRTLEETKDEISAAEAQEETRANAAALEKCRAAKTAKTQEINEAELSLNSAQTAAAQMQEAAEATNAAIANAQQRKRAEEEYEKAQAEAQAWTAALAALREAAKEETLKIFKPLLEIVRPITAGCLPTELDHKGLDFGRYEGPHFIPFEAFSKSQRAVTVAGLQAALATRGAGIVIVDEFNNLDAQQRPQFIANLDAQIQAGAIAQAIVLDNRAPEFTAPAGAKVQALA